MIWSPQLMSMWVSVHHLHHWYCTQWTSTLMVVVLSSLRLGTLPLALPLRRPRCLRFYLDGVIGIFTGSPVMPSWVRCQALLIHHRWASSRILNQAIWIVVSWSAVHTCDICPFVDEPRSHVHVCWWCEWLAAWFAYVLALVSDWVWWGYSLAVVS